LAERHEWCKELPVVDYKDEEGKEYCIFHAPQGKKGVSVEEFNKLIFKRINEAKVKNDCCNLSGTVFSGDIIFSQVGVLSSLPPIDFSHCEFNGETGFSDVLFSGGVDFSSAKFSKEAAFVDAEFRNRADFSGANFQEVAYFTGVEFSGYAHFYGARFGGRATFWVARFTDEAIFRFAEFNEEADFSGAEFSKKASFKFTRFKEGASFSRVIFNGIADFHKAKFEKETDFHAVTFNERTYFFEETFIKGADLRRLIIEKTVRFENVNLKKVSFMDTNLRKIDFINCNWYRKFDRDVLYDELLLYTFDKLLIYTGEVEVKESLLFDDDKEAKNSFQGLKQRFSKLRKYFSHPKERTKKVEILYRRLKQKYKEEHNEPEVSNWHYGEKEMFRKRNNWRRYFPSLSTLYWLSSGYGERAVRAGVVLILLILVLSVLFGLTGLSPLNQSPPYEIAEIKGWADVMNIQNLWAFILNTLQYATFERKPDFIPKTIYGGYLKLAARILIPLQAALFALAARNRFRR